MPFIVLGIDGLDYNLVKRWSIKGLQQKYHGTHSVSMIKPLYTPIIWCAFLIGDNPVKYGYSIHYIDRKRALYGYNPILKYVYKFLRTFTKRKLGVRDFFVKLGLFSYNRIKNHVDKIEAMPPELKKKSIIAELKKRNYKVWIKAFPAYNDAIFAKGRLMTIGLSNKIFRERLKLYEKYTRELISDLLSNINKYDVFFYYTALIDLAEHAFCKFGLREKAYLYSYYKKMEKIALEVSSKYPTLIVSDHGFDFKNKIHSDYGFWSTNFVPPLVPKTIMDFKKLILDAVEKYL